MTAAWLNHDDLNQLPVTCQQVIPRDWIDEMGHVNVMWYTHLFSRASMGFFDSFGLNREYFEANKTGSFALKVHIIYVREIKAGQSITIHTRAIARSERRLHYMHFLLIDEGPLLATTAEYISGHIDMRVRRTAPFPPQIAARYDAILAEHERLDWNAPVCGALEP
jgi:acyl-CoA thioester hydrolase